MQDLRDKLYKYGIPVVVKKGYVLTVFISGTGLSNYNTVLNIQEAIIKRAGKQFPVVEVMQNDENYFLMILKPQPNE